MTLAQVRMMLSRRAKVGRRLRIPGAVALGVFVLAAGAGCGSSSSSGSKPPAASNAAPPSATGHVLSLKVKQTKVASSRPRTKLPGNRRIFRAFFSVGSGMTVSIVGGGGAVDTSSGSNCTTSETNDTFTTKGDNERHDYGFDSRGGGSCSIQPSWSYFKVSVKDAGGKEVGHGESLWVGQTSAVDSYFTVCDQAHQGERPKPWVGLKCTDNAGQDAVKIERG